MSFDVEHLYRLLPQIYRSRDAERGEPLKALLAILGEQSAVLDEDLAQLYDNLFIETCAEWVVPYIGDLVGAHQLYPSAPSVAEPRAVVANTIGYRRRKGTLLALEQSAMDVSGRPVRVVEFFRRLAVSQSFRHLRENHEACVDLRRGSDLARLGGPFEVANRTIDVRRIAPRPLAAERYDSTPLDIALHGGGRSNIPNLGAFVWRWNSYRVKGQAAITIDARRFMVSPLGADMPLFNDPLARYSFERLTTRADVPQPISRREFHEDPAAFYGAERSFFVWVDGVPVDVADICACNLSDLAPYGHWPEAPAGKVAIDPVLGRIAFGADRPTPGTVTVDYCYGFAADIGGGPYDRSPRLSLDRTRVTWRRWVSSPTGDGSATRGTLETAIAEYGEQPPGTVGLIIVSGFGTEAVDLTGPRALRVPFDSELWIIAASGGPEAWDPVDVRTTLRGSIDLIGAAGPTAHSADVGRVFLSGLMIAGSLRVGGGGRLRLTLKDCTIVPGGGLARDGAPLDPGEPSLTIEAAGSELHLERTITGPLRVHSDASAHLEDCVVDALARWRVAYSGAEGWREGGALTVSGSTVIGRVRTRQMELASNSIFLARRPAGDPWPVAIWVTRRQAGCMRFCYMPSDSLTPRQYQCLPDDPAREHLLEPQFVTLRYGSPSYALLSGDCPVAVWRGADDQSQMGVFHHRREPQAIDNLVDRLEEHVPFGLEAGIFLIPSRGPGLPIPVERTDYGRKLGDSEPELHPPNPLAWSAIGSELI